METKREKLIVFDFDGTLTIDSPNPYKELLVQCGFPRRFFNGLKNRYCGGLMHKILSPKLVMSIFAKMFRLSKITKKDVERVVKLTTLIGGLEKTMKALKEQGFHIYILSNGLKPIIEKSLGKKAKYFDEIFANEVVYDSNDVVFGIATEGNDLEGKATLVEKLMLKHDICPKDTVFVGNDANDVFVAKTKCNVFCLNAEEGINPEDKRYWDGYKNNVTDLTEILPDILTMAGVENNEVIENEVQNENQEIESCL